MLNGWLGQLISKVAQPCTLALQLQQFIFLSQGNEIYYCIYRVAIKYSNLWLLDAWTTLIHYLFDIACMLTFSSLSLTATSDVTPTMDTFLHSLCYHSPSCPYAVGWSVDYCILFIIPSHLTDRVLSIRDRALCVFLTITLSTVRAPHFIHLFSKLICQKLIKYLQRDRWYARHQGVTSE